MSAGDGFLDRSETRALQTIYETWLNKLKPEMLSNTLFEMHLLSRFEMERLGALQTSHEKSAFIFHNALMKSTYNDMSRIRKALLQHRTSAHKALAKLLPTRGEYIDYDEFDGGHPPPPPSGGTPRKPRSDTQQFDQDYEMVEEDNCLDLEGGPESSHSSVSHAYTDYANPSASSSRRVGKVQPQRQVAKSAANADYTDYKPQLPCYQVKPGNDEKKGKGLCVIIRNFTSDLTGYEKDAQVIKSFFGDELGYKILADNVSNDFSLVDLSEKKMMEALRHIQAMLKNPFDTNKYDRFFLFILSHGDEKGIKTCAPNKRDEELDSNGEPVHVPVDDIVKMFTHDEVPLLKTFPKCFVIQACQGSEVAKNAAGPDYGEYDPYGTGKPWTPPSHNLTIGADMMVCVPSEKGTYSWVPSSGSWYIQAIIENFRHFYQKEHLVDIMVAVNEALSKKMGKGKVGDGEVIDVSQMPGLSCTFTKKFFLSIPPISPYIEKK